MLSGRSAMIGLLKICLFDVCLPIFKSPMTFDIYPDSESNLVLPTETTLALLGQSTSAVTTPIIAQQFEQDFFSSSGKILGDFVESGQLWALLIGVVIGYVIRGITTY